LGWGSWDDSDDTDNFYINDSDETKSVTSSTSASIKIKYKPKFTFSSSDNVGVYANSSPIQTLGNTWTTTTNGLEEKSYTFKLQFSVAGVDGDTGGSDASTTLTTETPVMSLSVSSSTVKKERTKALIRANTALSSGNMILFWDKYNGDLALGPFNNLTSTKDKSTNGGASNGAKAFTITFDGRLPGTADGTSGKFSASTYQDFVNDELKNDSTYGVINFGINNVAGESVSNIVAQTSGSGSLFNPHLGISEGQDNQGKKDGNAIGNFGWYESESVNPFLEVREIFKIVSIKDDLGSALGLKIAGTTASSNTLPTQSFINNFLVVGGEAGDGQVLKADTAENAAAGGKGWVLSIVNI